MVYLLITQFKRQINELNDSINREHHSKLTVNEAEELKKSADHAVTELHSNLSGIVEDFGERGNSPVSNMATRTKKDAKKVYEHCTKLWLACVSGEDQPAYGQLQDLEADLKDCDIRLQELMVVVSKMTINSSKIAPEDVHRISMEHINHIGLIHQEVQGIANTVPVSLLFFVVTYK